MNNMDKLAELQSKRASIEVACKSSNDKNSARERIKLLFDEGSFVEINAFVTGVDAAEGVVSGYGTVNDRLVYAYSQDYSSTGGALGGANAKKITYTLDMAAKMGAPVVSILDSKGAKIAEGIEALAAIGEIYAKNTELSGLVPQISVVLGDCAGGAVYTPSISDFVFMSEKNANMYINSPSVISGNSGEECTADEVGSAKACSKNGSADFVCATEEECFANVKRLLDYLPSNNLEGTPVEIPTDDINRISENIINMIPENGEGFDIKNIIKEVADNADLYEVSAEYAKSIVTGFVKLNGMTVGVVANNSENYNGDLCIKAAKKAAKFINFCDSFNIPVVTFVDCGGFVACKCQENNGLSDAAATLLATYASVTVPKVTVVVRKAYGSAYLAMGSKVCGADMVFAYPTAEISITSPEVAANIMYSEEIAASADPIACRTQKIDEYKNIVAAPYTAASKGYIDDVIEPDSTRPRLISALEMLSAKRVNSIAKKHINMPL